MTFIGIHKVWLDTLYSVCHTDSNIYKHVYHYSISALSSACFLRSKSSSAQCNLFSNKSSPRLQLYFAKKYDRVLGGVLLILSDPT